MASWAVNELRKTRSRLERMQDNERLRRKLKGDFERSDLVEKVVEDVCQNYCKYPTIWDTDFIGYELSESEICRSCPLNQL